MHCAGFGGSRPTPAYFCPGQRFLEGVMDPQCTQLSNNSECVQQRELNCFPLSSRPKWMR
ncbi:hypothetical protein PpBr36_01519 [Pyricularia pennisetigena]|uniref:hypothetical protein n=1 Tax=Pyricularia pennisetigena TaxID=1578925 RepID=UPI00114F583D|nr:hypothetical protein PpBr36_01519 [Pyricularia pennisetigena]TLS28461.1 hypothetical protein PpBr36_01519 [Pyricularia pennisetigena]